MRVLIFGASGMLGHKLWQMWSPQFDVYGTLSREARCYAPAARFDLNRMVEQVRAEEPESVARALAQVQPSVVVNCIGIVKQRPEGHQPLPSLLVNAVFPHRLAEACRQIGVRLIHLSTDCVFSGRKGHYVEDDIADATDLYGRTKFLGEVSSPGCLTIRTSMIGRELETSRGLLEWFLCQQGGTVRGYTHAIFSGFTTLALARLLARIMTEHPHLAGIWHVAAEPMSKYDLLMRLNQYYGLDIQVEPDVSIVCNRSLDASRFRRETGIIPPNWDEMLAELVADPTPYSEKRRVIC